MKPKIKYDVNVLGMKNKKINDEGSHGVIPEALIFLRFSTFSCAC